jgi:sulfite reductase (NADPH) flavoprotein alpha-component
MIEHGSMFWTWLQDGASVYVCGDASRMAKDGHAALHSIVEKQDAMSSQAAEEYIQTMKDEHRYHRDVY